MPIFVFDSISRSTENKKDTNLFVQKHCLGPSSIESKMEEDFDRKIQFGIKNLKCPNSMRGSFKTLCSYFI